MGLFDEYPALKVRKRRRAGPEVGPASPFYCCIPTGMRGPTHTFWADLTPFSRSVRLMTISKLGSPAGYLRKSAAFKRAAGIFGAVFYVLFIQRGREKSSKGAHLEIRPSSKH